MHIFFVAPHAVPRALTFPSCIRLNTPLRQQHSFTQQISKQELVYRCRKFAGDKDILSFSSLLKPFSNKLLVISIKVRSIPESLAKLMSAVEKFKALLIRVHLSVEGTQSLVNVSTILQSERKKWCCVRTMRPRPRAVTCGPFLPSGRVGSNVMIFVNSAGILFNPKC